MKTSVFLAAIGLLCVPMLNVDAAHAAGASRTWISGVGSDGNPCSRTAPCLTLAGAYLNTAPGGEIDCLDEGGVGTLNITMAITIDCRAGFAGILGSVGVNGMVVNAGAGDIVNLKGLSFQGLSIGPNAIRFLAGHSLYVTDTVIQNFTNWGIDFESNGNSLLVVADTFIANTGSGASSGGILVQPGGTGTATVTLDRVRLADNVVGILANGTTTSGGVRVELTNSIVTSNAGNGVWALRGGGAQTIVIVDGNKIVNNAGTGVLADTSSAVLLSNSTVARNGVGANVTGGTLFTYGNNVIDNNAGVDLSPSAVARTTK